MRPESQPNDRDLQNTNAEFLVSSDALELNNATQDRETRLIGLVPPRLRLKEEILCRLIEYLNVLRVEESIQHLTLHRITKTQVLLSYDDSSLEPDLTQPLARGMEDSVKLAIGVNRKLEQDMFNQPIGRDQNLETDSALPNFM